MYSIYRLLVYMISRENSNWRWEAREISPHQSDSTRGQAEYIIDLSGLFLAKCILGLNNLKFIIMFEMDERFLAQS